MRVGQVGVGVTASWGVAYWVGGVWGEIELHRADTFWLR